MIGIIHCGSSWFEDIKKRVAELNKPYKVIMLNEIKDCDFELFSGIIISGAPTLLTKVDLKKYLDPFKFIKTVNIPILGICLGHQIIGLLYGAEIHHGKMIDKKEKIEIVKEDKLFLDVKNNALFRQAHQEFVDLPQEFCLLAKSETCNNVAMKHKNKKIYGTQFHPEVSGNSGKKLFRNFLNMCS